MILLLCAVRDELLIEFISIFEKGRQSNRKRAEKMRELRMADSEYRTKMEEKERLALEREKKRQELGYKEEKGCFGRIKGSGRKRQSGSHQRA